MSGTSAADMNRSVLARFEEIVHRFPDQPALSGEQNYSYAELNCRANRIARAILARDSSDAPVALLFDHGTAVITAVMGAIKAGKVWAALNPAAPLTTLRTQLEDLQASLVIVGIEHQTLGAQLSSRPLNLEEIDSEDGSNLDRAVSADAPAAVFYTSGSTGIPKGAIRRHAAIVRRSLVDANEYGWSARDRFSLLLPCSYAAALPNLFGALLNGATLAPFDAQRHGLNELTAWLQTQPITCLHIPSVLLRQWVRTLDQDQIFPSLRCMRVGGPILRTDLERIWSHLPPDAIVISQYASTETGVVARMSMTRMTPLDGDVLPVGWPVDDAEILLLDDAGGRVEVGEVGRIHIRDKLFPGYWRRPDLDSQFLQPDPEHPGVLILRTDDWGRSRPDGCLEFVGRTDDVVKVRNHRVELNTVHAALLNVPGVLTAAVIAQSHVADAARLVAYVVAAAGTELTTGQLRSALAATLPLPAIPDLFVHLPELPLLPNGKVNARALPPPDTTRPHLSTEYRGPRTPIEETLAGLWGEVFEIDRVGIDDRFLELGGHSLRAMQLIARIQELFQVELSQERFFDAATVAAQAQLILDARSQQDALDQAIAPRDTREPARLAHSQLRVWFLARLEPDRTPYNLARAHRLIGPLDVDALRASLAAINRRHDILRTTFALIDDEPRQIVHPELMLDFELIDVADSPAETQHAAVLNIIEAEHNRPFDFEAGPLARYRLIRLGEADHVLVRVWNHVISDGWSGRVFGKELSSIYAALIHGRQPLLPPLPIQYADYAVWQRERLHEHALGPQLAYWKQQLEGVSALDLPTDRPRPPIASYRGAHVSVELSPQLTHALKELSRRLDTTLFMTLLAAFQVLLHRYAGQDDIAVGSPIAGRGRTELEGLIGFFANTLVLRSNLSGNPSFAQLLTRVRQTALGAYTHQDVPFERLVEELSPAREMNRNPLFQVAFAFQEAAGAPLALEGLTVTRLPVESHAAKFDLSVFVSNLAGGLGFIWEYATDLFDASTITRMASHFEVLLKAIVADPDQSIDSLPLLSESERRQQLIAWNETATAYPRHQTVHALVEAQVTRTPTAVAVGCQGRSLTYGELNARANQLAHELIARGVGAEDRVALCLERSPELIVSLLAILKAGGAYVPLDPDYPAARLAALLADTSPRVVITQQRLLDRLPPNAADTLCLDRDADRIGAHPIADPAPRATPGQLAYVLYTSGSTGTPKGVMVEHRAIVRLVCDTNYVQLGTADCIAQVATVAFDAATFEIWGALVNGARLVILPREVTLDPPRFVDALRQEQVTTMFLTSTLFNEIVRAQPAAFATLTQLLVGGEALDPDSVNACLRSSPPQHLRNAYGPTEVTTFATWYEVDAVAPGARSIPIGRPVGNTTVYILDRHLQPTPIGVVGEIYIGGDGVARGYWNHPELTAERFVSDPFSSHPNARLYRTGDRAFYRADGAIDFVGRADDQIKLRGFRIEPDEIETVLESHPHIRHAVVIARSDGAGYKRLVAYVVPRQPVKIDPQSLKAHLHERLPAFMQPAAYVQLERFPLTPTGKLDRTALPEPDDDRVSEGIVPPRNPIEEAIAEVWREVLKREQVGVHDNFFDVGGHSLLATQVVVRLERVLNIDVPLRTLFERPTVAGFAAELRERLAVEKVPSVHALERSSHDVDHPLSFAQQRMWFLDRLLPDKGIYNVPLTVRLRGPLDRHALQQALDAVVARHEALRTRFQLRNGEPVQVVDSPQPVSLTITDLSALEPEIREARTRHIINTHARLSFDLETERPLRAVLLCHGSEEHVLQIIVHHIAFDGWSMAIFNHDLSAAYHGFVNGNSPQLPALAIQYVDYAVWQRDWLQGELLARQLTYWRQQLAYLPALELPTDHPRPPVFSYRGARLLVDLPGSLRGALQALGTREHSTLFMTMLAAFYVLLHRQTRQVDFAVGSPIAGRSRPEVERLIGFFVNTLVLRADLSGQPTFREFLARVRETTLGAYQHQDVPFEQLVEELSPARNLSRTPLFQVMFSVQNTPDAAFSLKDVETTRMLLDNHHAKFDLNVSVRETSAGLTLRWEYAADLFDPATIARLSRDFELLLSELVADPDQKITGEDSADLNGRQDRRMQTSAEAQSSRPDSQGSPHRGAMIATTAWERRLVEIWENLLNTRPIRVTDDFFDLGGHSLLAVRMLSDVERICGRRLPLTVLFEDATIRHLAAALEQQDEPHLPAAVMAVHRDGTRPPFFFWHGDLKGGGLYCFELARELGSDQPFFALEAHGDPESAVSASIEELARAQVATLRTLQRRGPYRLGGFCHGGLVAFEVAQQLIRQGEQVSLLFLIDVPLPTRRARQLRRIVSRSRIYRRRFRLLSAADWKSRRSEVIRFFTTRSTRHEDPVVGELSKAYERAMRAYSPQPYDAAVTFVQSHDADLMALDVSWRAIAPQTQLIPVEGRHLDFITDPTARRSVADRLRTSLNEVQADDFRLTRR